MGETVDRELAELVARFRELQAQANSLIQQVALIDDSVSKHDSAISALKQIKELQSGNDILVHIGAGVHVYAKLSNVEKVIVGLGAGVSMEKTPDGAISVLERRKNEMIKNRERLTQAISQIEDEMEKLQSQIASKAKT